MSTFINISNHPSSGWGEDQKMAALGWGAAEITACCSAAVGVSEDGESIYCAKCGAIEPTTTSQIKDIPFPAIPPEADMDVVRRMADDMFNEILAADNTWYAANFRGAVHLMGEQSFCFILASLLIEAGITVLVSTTAREVVEKDGVKTSIFRFVQFRALNPRRVDVGPDKELKNERNERKQVGQIPNERKQMG